MKKAQITDFSAGRRNNLYILMETVATLKQAAFEKPAMARQIKKAQVEGYFQKTLSDIDVIRENAAVVEAVSGFESAVMEDGKPPARRFHAAAGGKGRESCRGDNHGEESQPEDFPPSPPGRSNLPLPKLIHM